MQLCANYVLGRETTSAKMNALGKSALLLGRVQSEEELLGQVRSINMGQIEQAISDILIWKR